MNRDEVIALAHEADEYTDENGTHIYAFNFDELKRAFEAVAAREREACAEVSEDCGAIFVAKRIRARSNEAQDKGQEGGGS